MIDEEIKLLFRRVARTEFGEEQNLEEIERKLFHLRKGAALTYEDLDVIANPKYLPFSKYWMWPSKDQLKNKLNTTAGMFKILPLSENKIIRRLNAIFRNISLVSIILRFARPDQYAIYSPPVLQILRIERGRNDVEEYMNYILEMRTLKDSFRVQNVADVDKIVWAIFHLQGRYATIMKEILADVLPDNLSPEELIIYFSHSPIRIAKAYLKQKDHMTAGFWAAKELEKFLDEECRRNAIYILDEPNRRSNMIWMLVNETELWGERLNRSLLYETKKLRNKIVPGTREFTRDDVERFIFFIEHLKDIAQERN